MTDWVQLTHAYGSAQDIPGLLERAVPDPNSPVWTELWSRLCHQGTVYPASYAAVPALHQMARRWSAADRMMPLVLASAIVASVDLARDAEDPRVSFPTELSELAGLTEEALQEPDLREDPGTYIYLLQALLAFEGVAVWGEWLDGVNDGEYEVPCPSCGVENFVAFGPYGHFTALDSMYMKEPDIARIPLLPKQPHDLGPLGRRLHARALADGQTDFADRLTYVFGDAHCVECGAVFQVDQAVEAQWGT